MGVAIFLVGGALVVDVAIFLVGGALVVGVAIFLVGGALVVGVAIFFVGRVLEVLFRYGCCLLTNLIESRTCRGGLTVTGTSSLQGERGGTGREVVHCR